MAHVITPISRLLVANRGEIARRINRTAQAMGISTVAIYADGDVNAPFVLEADTAIALNGKSTGETYLNVAKVLDAARRSGADAIHPGYGFLSENQAFAQAVIDAGVKWLGPSPEGIGLMGDQPVDIGRLQPVGFKRLINHIGEVLDRMTEDLTPIHAHMARRLGRGRTAIDIELLPVIAIGMQMGRENTGTGCALALGHLDRFEDSGTGTITEKNAVLSFSIIYNCR